MRRIAIYVLCALPVLPGCGPKRPPQDTRIAEDRGPLFAVALAYPDAGPGRRAVTINSSTAPETLHVATANVITLDDVTSVRFRTDVDPEGIVEFELTPEGRQRLARATADHVGGRMVVLLRGVVHSSPIVQMPITEGIFYLSGGLADDELQDLAEKLSGALTR